jgi:hypothetical protein
MSLSFGLISLAFRTYQSDITSATTKHRSRALRALVTTGSVSLFNIKDRL